MSKWASSHGSERIAALISSNEESASEFINWRAQRMMPSRPALAHISARTAVILAKLRDLAEPRPPCAPRTSASPRNTGLSFGGSATSTALAIDQSDCDRRIVRTAASELHRREVRQALAQQDFDCFQLPR